MYSLHLTGSPWFLVLIPPGLWILWRQYRRLPEAGGLSRSALLLWSLQALALILLALSLTAPELRRHKVEFHNPAVLILRDQSGSFRGGAYLGLGGRYRDFEAALAKSFGGRKFDVRVADFAETAWPVSGFPKPGRPEAKASPPSGDAPLTSLAALADFVDSAAIPNLQAAFLFSDGRSNLDSGRASRTWRVPLFPVVFSPDSIAEIQPEHAGLSLDASAPGGGVEVEAVWRPVGRGGEGTLKLLQGKKVLLARKLPAPDSAGRNADPQSLRFAWSPERSVLEGREPIHAVLQPAQAGADFDPYNDTLGAAFPQGRAERNIHVFKPVRSLDEKGMLGVLQSWEGTRVSFFGQEDLGRLALTAKDQVWVEAGSLNPQGRLAAWLQATAAKVVAYSRSDAGRNLQVAGEAMRWRRFGPGAEIKAGKAAAEAFPDEVVRLKSLASDPLEAPEGAAPLVEITEGGKRGMLMGRISLGRGKGALFFCLPAVWDALFDPQGDFATRGNIAEYVKAAQRLGDMEDGAIRAILPARAYDGAPFDVDVRLPEERNGKAAGPLALSIASLGAAGGAGYSREWPEASVKNVTIPAGSYRLELKAGAAAVWSDTLEVAPKAALELARIGFDRAVLEDAASRSGGRVLAPGPAGDPAQVSSVLPRLPDAQIRMEKTSSIRLYNTWSACLCVLLLLSLSWLLRKKWDLD